MNKEEIEDIMHVVESVYEKEFGAVCAMSGSGLTIAGSANALLAMCSLIVINIINETGEERGTVILDLVRMINKMTDDKSLISELFKRGE